MASGDQQITGRKQGGVANLTNAGKGRPKGVPNKSTATMKAAIQSVYDKLQAERGGDHGHFLEWAKEEPTEFYKLAAKLIPVQTEITGRDGAAIQVEQVENDAAAFRSRLLQGIVAGTAGGRTGETVQ